LIEDAGDLDVDWARRLQRSIAVGGVGGVGGVAEIDRSRVRLMLTGRRQRSITKGPGAAVDDDDSAERP
jgi:hypothetical protein